MKRLVFFDVDDTLLSPPYAAIARLCRLIGKNLPPEDDFLNRKHIHFHKAFPEVFRSAKEMWVFVLLALPFGYFRSQKPLNFDVRSMALILGDHRVYLVSKNPPSFTRWRIQRLREIFGVSLGDRYIACGPMFGKGRSKSEIIRAIAKERDVSLSDCLLVDDSLENLREAAGYKIQGLAVSAAWNVSEIQTEASGAQPFAAVETDKMAEAVSNFLGEAYQQDVASTFFVPPLTPLCFLRLVGIFWRRCWLYGERFPRRQQIIAVARRRMTSLLHADPHRAIRHAIKGVLERGEPVHSFRMLSFKQAHQTTLLALNVQALISTGDLDLQVRNLRELMRRSLMQRGVCLGPSSFYHFFAMNRATEIRRILETQRIQTALAAYVESHKVPLVEAQRMAQKYAQQITAGRTYLGCFVTTCLLSLVIKKIFRKVTIETHPKISELEHDHFLIYASTHRSYLDSGILYRALAATRGSLPFVVAAEKMRQVWIGKLGLVAGAIFLQRRFVDGIYAAVLAEHVAKMQLGGSSLEIFLEGQRSRSGLTLPPKKGIASIIWNNLDANDVQKTKVAIVPVSFAYNKLPESELLLRESFEERKKLGRVSLREMSDIDLKAKRRKSKGAKLRSTWRRLRSAAISDCYIRFAEPIILSRDPALGPAADSAGLQNKLNEAMFSINRNTAVLDSSLLCLATLSSPENHLTQKGAHSFLQLTQEIFALYDLPQPQTVHSDEELSVELSSFVRLPFVNRKFKRYGVDEQLVLSISDLDIERASYYKNNVLHFFVMPAILTYALADVGTGRVEELDRFFGHTFTKMQVQYFLPPTYTPQAFIRSLLAIFAARGLVDLQGATYTVNREATDAYLFQILARVGAELAVVDLPDLLDNFRRLHKRIAVSLPVMISAVSRLASGAAHLTRFDDGTFFVATSHALVLQDELEFISDAGKKTLGSVVETQVDGAVAQRKQYCGADDVLSCDEPLAQKVSGTLRFRRRFDDPSEINNLSASGAFLRTEAALLEGDLLTCILGESGAEFKVTAKVSRRTQTGVGVQFVEMSEATRVRLLLLAETR